MATDEPPTKRKKTVDSVSPSLLIDQKKRLLVENKFLVKMPEDFYQFWTFLHELNSEDPNNILTPFDLRY